MNHHFGLKKLSAAFLLAAGYGLATLSAPATAQKWQPTKPVELIAANAPGGGSDRILRLFVKIVKKFIPTTVTIVNKPGGGGAIAYNYVSQNPGGHHLALASRSLLTNNIAGHGPRYTTLTPVVHLFTEYISVNVKPVSPIKSGKMLIDFMKRDSTAISFGIATSLGAPNHQGAAVALKVAGFDIRKMKNVIFPSGGSAITALLGGHIDVVPVSVAFGASLLRNKQTRMIALTAPQRLPGILADVPTWKEQGFDIGDNVSTYRVFVAAKGMTPAQNTYWEETFRRATADPVWKKEMADNYWQHTLLGSAETTLFLAKDEKELRAFLGELGLAK